MVVRYVAVRVCLTLFLVFTVKLSIKAQDIEAQLKTDDNTSGFTIKDSSGNTILTAGGNGNVGIGVGNPSSLFQVGSYLSPFDQYGRNVSLRAEDAQGGTAGNILLQGGDSHGASPSSGASIKVNGGLDDTGGGIALITGLGDYQAGDILLRSGLSSSKSSSSGSNPGNVIIETGFIGDPLYELGGNFNVTCAWGVQAGNISLTAGNTDGGTAGNITLKPGIDYSQNNDGRVIVNGSGTYTGTWTQTSDRRLKKNIEKLNIPSDQVLNLNPVKYEMRKDEYPEKNLAEGEQIGLIAQEVEELFPELVRTDDDGFKSIDYTKVSVLLLDVVKEQNKKLEKQNKLFEELEKRLNKIESRTNLSMN